MDPVILDQWETLRLARRILARPEEVVVARTADEALTTLHRIEQSRRNLPRSGTPWGSGWVGFLSYDFGRALVLDRRPRSKLALPLLRFYRIGSATVTQNRSVRTDGRTGARLTLEESDSRRSYIRKIRDIQRELRAGNAYEVNLSRRWTWRFDRTPDPVALYDDLSRRMRPRYGYFERTPTGAVMGFSPELFFSVRNGTICAEPIKGTAPAGAGNLRRSSKDRAELLMIEDLFRNDIGKISTPGSVRAAGPLELKLPYARHLYSRVTGRLRRDVGLPEIVAALFPSGSVTGAPKIAACEIIDRLEPFSREEAFGAVGWVGRDRMEFAVSIRTAFLRGRTLRYTAGGGITVYSDPGKEYEETLLKASGLMEGLEA